MKRLSIILKELACHSNMKINTAGMCLSFHSQYKTYVSLRKNTGFTVNMLFNSRKVYTKLKDQSLMECVAGKPTC